MSVCFPVHSAHALMRGAATTTHTTSSSASALSMQPAMTILTALPASLERNGVGRSWVREMLVLEENPGMYVLYV